MINWLKDLFIPHSKNNHHPHFWRKTSVAIFVSVLVFVELAVLSQSLLVFKQDSWLASILPAVLTDLTNEERQTQNLASLKPNPLLEQAAKLKAEDMAVKGYFSHNTPEGYLPWYWLQKVGYSYAHAGENLAVNFTDSKDVVEAWMKSPTHRDNIVKNNYTEIGIAMAEGTYKGQSAIFVVQFFGTPNAPIITPVVTSAPIVAPAVVVAVTTPKPAPVVETEVLGSEAETVIEKVPAVIEVTAVEKLAASPRQTGAYLLYALLTLAILAFLLAVFIKIRIQHPRVIMIGLLLIFIIIGITIFNQEILNSVVIAQNIVL